MKVCVVGLGYVGLPLAIRLSEIGYQVLGIDRDRRKIGLLKKGVLPFAQKEPDLKKKFGKVIKKKKTHFSKDFLKLSSSRVVFICVDTPVSKNGPDYSSLISAIKNVSKYFKRGTIIIIESTISPLTTQDLIIPFIEKESNMKVNKDFAIAVVPERIRPNYIFKQLTTLSRVIGVSDKKIQPFLTKIYSKITSGDLDFVDTTTAEVAKTVENTYRDINIAFANEIALACEHLGVDVWKIRELVNKSPWRDMHKPGSGVGGHCIPKDPWLLSASVKNRKLKLIQTARQINDSMPNHIYELASKALREASKDITKSRLAILGYSYVENSDDSRNSPTQTLIKILEKQKIKFAIQDPYIHPYNLEKPEEIIRGTDCLIIMVAHRAYKRLKKLKFTDTMMTKIIIDGRNLINKTRAQEKGFIYKGIGNI